MAKRGSEKLAGLVRMLNLLPYFEAHPGRTVMEAAKDLGRTPQEIMDDLNRLWCCGLPGLLPGDLVEMSPSYTGVKIFDTKGLDRPLRLTQTEAGALLLALENLEQVPGLAQRTAVHSAAAKLRGIMDAKAVAVYDSAVDGESVTGSDGADAVLDAIRLGVETQREVSFEYYSRNTEATSSRVISVALLFNSDEHTYVVGWDRDRQAHRTFRVDGMSHVEVLDCPASPHVDELKFNPDAPFALDNAAVQAELLVHPNAEWLADYVPIRLGDHHEGPWRAATINIGSQLWFSRFILEQGGEVLVSAPDTLANTVVDQARLGLAAYDCAIDN